MQCSIYLYLNHAHTLDNFKLAAAAIVAASSSFSAKHGSRAVKKEPTTRRAYTFNKKVRRGGRRGEGGE